MPLLRLPRVTELTGWSRSKLYEDFDDGLMVQPIKMGARAVAIYSEELDAILAARAGGASEDQIRALVRGLHAKRATAAAAALQLIA